MPENFNDAEDALSLLLSSTKNNDAEGIKKALASGADVNYFFENGYTALYWAAQEGCEQAAAALLKGGANPEIKASNGVSPVHMSIQNNDLNMTILLLQYKANPNVTNSKGLPGIYYAVYLGYDEMIALLLQNNVNINFTAPYGRDILQLAIERKHISSFQLLAKKYLSSYVFDPNGIDEIALIEMVKNEEDIIFENLIWHFSIGFRKFVIINNLSTDKTLDKIHYFAKLTHNHAKVFIIEDPIEEYIQSRITTGAYDMTRSIWPNVKWVFPADADEFWVTKQPLKQALNKLPTHVDAINVLPSRYLASADYYDFNGSTKFYDKLHYRHSIVVHGKVAVKAQHQIKIVQGNHYIEGKDSPQDIQYIYGNDIGLTMHEFQIRSPEQLDRKLTNAKKVNLKAEELGVISIDRNMNIQWEQYTNYINEYGFKAGEVKFNESFVDLTFAIDDPLPIGRAMEIFANITGWDMH